jgi:hypothetical protein
MAKPWTCRLGFHQWRPETSEDGQRYLHCARCGRDDDPASRIHGLGSGH